MTSVLPGEGTGDGPGAGEGDGEGDGDDPPPEHASCPLSLISDITGLLSPAKLIWNPNSKYSPAFFPLNQLGLVTAKEFPVAGDTFPSQNWNLVLRNI